MNSSNGWPGGLAIRRNATPPPDYDDGEDEVMVIGIDFGTTYSGVAWATGADFGSNQINLITSWPGTGREEGKAPTELFYEDEQVMWGYEIPADADPVRWFKLLLLKDEDLDDDLRQSEFLIRGRKMLRENNKTAVDLIADYLRSLWKHVLETINKSRGDSVVEALVFNVVITVPAIWKGYARQDMKEAAKQAGILDHRTAGTTTLIFAPEPEAAALSTLCEPGRRAKKGDVYVICDAGGGTVDLISYQLDKVAPMAIHEVVEGIGGLCGGIFIDEAFEHMCKARLGRRWDRLSKAGIQKIMKGEWEYAIKPQFKPMASQKEYIVDVPAEAFGKTSLDDATREPYIKKGRIHFHGSHIEKAFTKSFNGIDTLIDGQISKARQRNVTITGIILVGGLGASPYLYEHLKGKHSRAGITVLQSGGIQPRTAICRGAVYKGFLDGAAGGADNVENPIMVTSTISRVNVGMKYDAHFDANKHSAADKKWCEHEGIWRASNQLQWYLKRGDNVSSNTPIRHGFSQIYGKGESTEFRVQMVQCDDKVAPVRFNSTMKSSCTINWSFDSVGLGSRVSEVEEEFNSASTGEKMKRLRFHVEMIPSGASAEFAVDCGGKKIAKGNVNLEFE